MKILSHLQTPPGTQILEILPIPAPQIVPGWHHRLNLFPNRALSHTALQAEQAGRMGRLALRGQMLSPGVVNGLEITMERGPLSADNSAPERQQLAEHPPVYYHLSAGLGLAANGEDVTVPGPLRLSPYHTRVIAPAASVLEALASNGRDLPSGIPAGGIPPGEVLFTRAVGPTLENFLEAEVDLPRLGVLVLQPISAEIIGRFDPEDTCERDPANDAYEDWQVVDGCRLLYYAWPTELAPAALLWEDPGPADPARRRVALGRWRNQLAYTIFGLEEALEPGKRLPWEAFGVPVGLAAFDQNWELQFVDRYAVVRAGGKPRMRSSNFPFSNLPGSNLFLWQARMEQFGEHMVEALSAASLDATAVFPNRLEAHPLDTLELNQEFRRIPPAGILPREVVSLFSTAEARAAGRTNRVGLSTFFPPYYTVDAIAAPVEQLDMALEGSAGLAPFNLDQADHLRLAVPVPQAWYEPDLLQVAEADPEFQQNIDSLSQRLGRWLNRRSEVRAKIQSLGKAIRNQALPFPDPDPEAAAGETVATDPLDPADEQLNSPEEAFDTVPAGAGWQAQDLEKLRVRLAQSKPFNLPRTAPLSALNAEQAAVLSDVSSGRLSYLSEGKVLVLQGLLEEKRYRKLVDLFPDPASDVRKAIDEIFKDSQANELSQLDALGVEGLLRLLDGKVKAADDRVDFGFLRVQTDIYRVRNLMLGNVNATRLATSPTLATIAQGESASATRQTVSDFYETLKKEKVDLLKPDQPKFDFTLPPDPPAPATPPAGSSGLGSASFSTFGSARSSLFSSTFSASFLSSTTRQLPATTSFAGSFTPVPKTQLLISPIKAFTAASLIKESGAQRTPADIIGQSPVIGASNLRQATVAERLATPKAPETRLFSVSTKFDVISILTSLGIFLDDISVPGVADFTESQTALISLKYDKGGQPKRSTLFLRDLKPNLSRLLEDPVPLRDDESAHFVGAIELLDHTIAVLRAVEGRIQDYRVAIRACQEALDTLNASASQANQRLFIIADQLAETRHDLAMARKLFADELGRIDALNERRDSILADHVQFLAYIRPRSSELRKEAAARPIYPAETAPAVPGCLSAPAAAPPELHAMVDMLRQSPLRWFKIPFSWLLRLDTLPALHATLQNANLQANLHLAGLTDNLARLGPSPSVARSGSQLTDLPAVMSARLGSAVQEMVNAQQQVMTQTRQLAAQFDLSSLVGQSWRQVSDLAANTACLGDLITAGHGRRDVAQAVSAELEQIESVSACLYAAFSRILPVLRLEWTERLSQFDEAVDLHNLGSLPRWNEVEFTERRAMQELVDWLFARVDPAYADANALISNLIRVSLLLASHAPVDRIIAGSLPRQTVVSPGARLDLNLLDQSRVRVGMQVLLYRQERVVAKAVVEDLSEGQAAARIISLHDATAGQASHARSLTLAAGTLAHFVVQ